MATAQSTAVLAATTHPSRKIRPEHLTTPFTFKSKYKEAPVWKPEDPIDLQTLIAKLTPEQLAETFSIDCYKWSRRMFREVWTHLGEQQRAFLDFLVHGGDETLADAKEALGLASTEEVEQVIADLRTQLRSMGIDPQEVYYASRRIEGRENDLVAHYHATWAFMDAHDQEVKRFHEREDRKHPPVERKDPEPSQVGAFWQFLVRKLGEGQFSEVVRIENWNWTAERYKEVMSALGPKQKDFCERIAGGSYMTVEAIQRELGFASEQEAEQMMSDLRKQLSSVAVNPQEIYAAELSYQDGKILSEYYATGAFTDAVREYHEDFLAA